MRRYTVEVGGKAHVIDVEETARDTFEVHVGGRSTRSGSPRPTTWRRP